MAPFFNPKKRLTLSTVQCVLHHFPQTRPSILTHPPSPPRVLHSPLATTLVSSAVHVSWTTVAPKATALRASDLY